MFRKITNLINKNEFLRKKSLSFSIYLHNYSYRLIKKFLVKPGDVHPKHRIMNYHQFFLDNIKKIATVIDIGCGNGLVAMDVAQSAKRVIGVDIQEKNIQKAKDKNNLNNLNFICGDAVKYDFSQLGVERFDKIILSNVLEHIDDRISFLKSLSKLSDTILLRVPMLTRDWLTVYKKENEYDYRLDPTHFIEYTKEELKRELYESNWKLKSYSVQFGELWGIVKNK